jgi:hypothetical protein
LRGSAINVVSVFGGWPAVNRSITHAG